VSVVLVIAVLLGLVVLLLAVPVDAAFRLEGIEAFKGEITIRWLFGLLRFRIPVTGVSPPRPPRPKASKARVKSEERGRANVVAVLRQAAFRQRVYSLVKDLVRAAHLHQLSVRIRLGLGDPADTGRLWAFLGPLNAAAQNLRNAEVRIEPEFVDPTFEFEINGRVRLVPLQFLALATAFALSPPSIRAWRTLRVKHA
jgi:hypothetical protein